MAGELQDLFDAQISEGGIGGGLRLPKAVVEIHDTLRIASVRGFRFGGQAPVATELRWLGPEDRPLFDIDRCQDILLEDFSIAVPAGKKLLAAAWIQNGVGASGPKAAPGLESSHVSWRNVLVRGQGNLIGGFHVKLFDVAKDIKNDHHSFDAVTVTGYTGAAFTLEGRNAKNLGFDRCHCIGGVKHERVGKYAIDTATYPGHGGAFFWNKGSVIANGEADFRIGDRNDTIKIDGVYSEKSARMLVMPDYDDGAGAACPVLLENYRFAASDPTLLPLDREIIFCQSVGPLSMIACKMGSNQPGEQLRIRYDPQPPPGAFNFIGNAILDDGEGPVFTASPPTMPYENGNLAYRDGSWRPLGSGLGP
jgi:hypothetical protein